METPRSVPLPAISGDPALEVDFTTLRTPLGTLRLLATREALVGVRLPNHGGDGGGSDRNGGRRNPVLDQAADELGEYFWGRRRSFSVPLALSGTPFQEEVWRALLTIPFGERRSYAWLAEKIGRPRAYRAVGSANGDNPLAIVVPCHRVVGADGSLTGYGGGLEAKRSLLEHESGQAGLFSVTRRRG